MSSINFGDLFKEATTLVTGEFDGIVSESTLTNSSNGKPMIRVKLQIEGGPNHGKTFFTQFVITVDNPTAMRMFFGNMKAFGLDKAYFETNPAPEQVAAAIQGKRCRFVVDVRQWQGVDRENVKEVKPPLAGMAGLPTPGAVGPTTVGVPSPSAGVPAPPTAGPVSGGSAVPPPPAF